MRDHFGMFPQSEHVNEQVYSVSVLHIQPDWFERDRIDVSEYDAFELCVRSDGRRFIANVGVPDMVRKDDVWQCFFFPRGGPEWENITVSWKCDPPPPPE